MLTSLLIGAALAGPGEWREPWSEKGGNPPSVTLSVAPLRLIDRPVLEGNAEFRLSPTRSFGIMGARPIAGATGPSEVGLQIREYVAGDFGSGLAFGAAANFTNPQIFQFRADRYSITPFLAAKVTLALFTIEARGGPELYIDNQQGFGIGPRLDLGAGISF
ncbi:MAG: hypothetical protein ACK4YP_15925 [Myxococcota bacterium]